MFNLLTITIWLLTCTPGQELYAHYGHTAIRVEDTERHTDLCYNYGTFSFDTDHFYWKFVRGETWYMLSVEPTEQFLYEYIVERRPVYIQELNLTESQKIRIAEALEDNASPEKCEYLYNFVEDNCSTRPFRLLKDVLGDSLRSTYTGHEGETYRNYIRRYTRRYTVIDGLINMIFGARADRTMHGEDRLFLPEELMFHIQEATLADGTPLVRRSRIAPFVIRPTRWWESYFPYLALFALAMACLSWYDRKRGRLSWGVDAVLGGGYVILLALTVFLTFFSIHPLVGFNWRLLVIPTIHVCARLPYILR
jgi:hypothetical protein